MRTCEEYREMISRLLDEDLSAEERSELERHAAKAGPAGGYRGGTRDLGPEPQI